MIRGTTNEGISSLSKKRHAALGLINDGVGGEGIELVKTIATGAVVERRDSIDNHAVTETGFPSGGFNGTFE